MKIKEIWEDIEILDNIYIPVMKKTFPVFAKDEKTGIIFLRNPEMQFSGGFGLTKGFKYEVELIKD